MQRLFFSFTGETYFRRNPTKWSLIIDSATRGVSTCHIPLVQTPCIGTKLRALFRKKTSRNVFFGRNLQCLTFSNRRRSIYLFSGKEQHIKLDWILCYCYMSNVVIVIFLFYQMIQPTSISNDVLRGLRFGDFVP